MLPSVQGWVRCRRADHLPDVGNMNVCFHKLVDVRERYRVHERGHDVGETALGTLDKHIIRQVWSRSTLRQLRGLHIFF